MGREMPAFKIEPETDEPFFSPEEQGELAELRKKQIEGVFTPEDGARLRELDALEKKARTGIKPLNAEEHKRYLELSRMDDYTPEESLEFSGLQERLDKAGKAEN